MYLEGMPGLVEALRTQAERRGLWQGGALTAPAAFRLVRDMPYQRASSRDPLTIIEEWRGTCSGKHYLLKAVLAEMGFPSKLIACTQDIRLPPERLPAKYRYLVEKPVVDVHNFLMVQTPEGEMIVDATWPVATEPMGTVVNREWIWGEDMNIACAPIESWVVPEGQDPQAFKESLLRRLYSPEELERRDRFIGLIGQLMVET